MPGSARRCERPRRPLLLAPLWLVILGRAAAVSVEGVHADHSDSDIDPDEFLWQKLPGRCCMQLMEKCPYDQAPRELCAIEGPDTCGQCEVFSDPDNFCHSSEEDCRTCGMALYCGKPPPLISGNKLCVGPSAIAPTCYDTYGTGMCASYGIEQCQAACRNTAECEIFIFYPAEMKGSCMLCRDLFHFKPTPEATTRAYTVAPAPPPPVPFVAKYTVVVSKPPSRPPAPPAPPPLDPPRYTKLGRAAPKHTDVVSRNVKCDFVEGVEFAVDRDEGYSDSTASDRNECCQHCGRKPGCTDFVFEPSSGTCVLLPHVAEDEIERRPNLHVVSGTMKIGRVAPETVSKCKFHSASGYAGRPIGPGTLPLDRVVSTRQDCCEACAKHSQCAKFTFNAENSNECNMFDSWAERFSLPLGGMLAGELEARAQIVDEASPYWRDPHALDGGSAPPPYFYFSPAPNGPKMPSFRSVEQSPPPPPPEADVSDSGRTQGIIQRASMLISFFFFFLVALFAYCFCSPEVLMVFYKLSGGRYGRQNRMPAVKQVLATAEQTAAQKRQNTIRKGLVPKDHAKVVVQTKAMTQSKTVDIGDCDDLAALLDRIFDDFSHLLNTAKRNQCALLCELPANSEAERWKLVTNVSNVELVRRSCLTLKLCTSKDQVEALDSMDSAFVGVGASAGASNGRRGNKPRSKASSAPPLRGDSRHQLKRGEREPGEGDSLLLASEGGALSGAKGSRKHRSRRDAIEEEADESEALRPSKANRFKQALLGNKKGGVERSRSDGDDSDDEASAALRPSPRGARSAVGGSNGRGPAGGWEEEDDISVISMSRRDETDDMM